MHIGINQNEDSTSLDPKIAPALWFHYNYDRSLEESDDEDSEESDDNEDMSDEDRLSEASDEDESIEETDDNGISEDDETDESDDDDDDDDNDNNAIAEAEVDETLLLYSISSKQLLATNRLDLKDHFYWITPQGWMLMLHRASHGIFLWNPFTSQRISLPFDQDRFLRKNYTRCLLSHNPTDPNCVVLVLSLHDTVIWHCSPGGTQWFTHEYQARRFHRHRGTVIADMSGLTAMGGKFYTIVGHNVVTLDFAPNPTFDIVHVKSVQNTMYNFAKLYSLESNGELFSLFFYTPISSRHKIEEIEVHKLDIPRRAWVKVDTLGDRAFFVNSKHFGASVNAKEACLEGNCIYFLMHNDKGLYVHSMERGTTAALNPGADLLDNVCQLKY